MDRQELQVLKNVLICREENVLQLCDIYFDKKIDEVKLKTEAFFEWGEIDTVEKRDQLLDKFVDPDTEEKFLLAIPGGIDAHVHLDTPGYEFREDIEHASLAAAVGGTTTIIDMPCTSIPPVTSLENFNTKVRAIARRSSVDYALWGGVPGNHFEEKVAEKNIFELAEAGVAGFKVYLTSGMDSFSELNQHQLEFVARVISKLGLVMAVHAEDKEIVSTHESRLRNINRTDWGAYCKSRNIQAEAVAIENLISVAEKTGCRIHIVHLSTKQGLDLIRKARSKNIDITAETCPHYLYFTQKEFENDSIRNYLKTAPPVKYEEDKAELWKGLNDGSIHFVTSDHAGCDPAIEKSPQNFWEVYGGIPGVEHRLPFLLSEGFMKGRLTLEKTIQLLASNAADYFGIMCKGYLHAGYDADIVLIDLWNSQIVSSESMHSKGKYTPFEGVKFNVVVRNTFLRGQKFDSFTNSNLGDLLRIEHKLN